MSMNACVVKIHQIPSKVTASVEKVFLQDMQEYAHVPRPQLVLDCSLLWDMDSASIHLLLSCLEEMMKSNGDVRLACLSAEAESALRTAKVDRLFEVYKTTESAVSSFQQRAMSLAPYSSEGEILDRNSKYAA